MLIGSSFRPLSSFYKLPLRMSAAAPGIKLRAYQAPLNNTRLDKTSSYFSSSPDKLFTRWGPATANIMVAGYASTTGACHTPLNNNRLDKSASCFSSSFSKTFPGAAAAAMSTAASTKRACESPSDSNKLDRALSYLSSASRLPSSSRNLLPWLGVAAGISVAVYATVEHFQQPPLEIFAMNTDSHPAYRDQEHYVSKAFPELSITRRFPHLKSLFDDAIRRHVNCFALVEIGANEIALFEDFFKERGFGCEKIPYNLHGGSFYFFLALDKKKHIIGETSKIYFTQTGLPLTNEQRSQMSIKDQQVHGDGMQYERSALVVPVYPAKKNTAKQVPIKLVLTHMGLSNEHRLLAMKKLGEALKEETGPLLLIGDFNSFDATQTKGVVYQPQIDAIQAYGYAWESRHLTEQGAGCTFLSHPYDVIRFFTKADFAELDALKKRGDVHGIRNLFFKVIERENISLLSTTLDGVFSKNCASYKTQVTSRAFIDGQIIDLLKWDADSLNEFYLKALRKQPAENPEPVLASDHAGIGIKLDRRIWP